MNFISKLNKVVEELKSNPQIYVAHYKVFEPNIEAIERVEEELGYKLDDSITGFYKECGGIQLIWLDENNESLEKVKEGLENENLNDWYFLGQNNTFDSNGCIWIPSIESVFLTPFDEFDFDTEEFDESITNGFDDVKIKLFDWFSSFNDVAFVLNGTSSPYLVMGDDNQATYYDSHFISLENYLNLLINTKGEKVKRTSFLSIYNDNGGTPRIIEKV